MKVLYLDEHSKFDSKGLVIALGFFDGFHLAHKKVLEEAVRIAKENNLFSCLLTFNESIASFIRGEKFRYLTSIDDKVTLAKELGFDQIALIETNESFVNLSHLDFYNDYLKDSEYLVSGFDYTFGRGRGGDINFLKEEKKDRLKVIDELKINGEKVGTKSIKENLSLGKITIANSLLGRPYSIKGNIYKRNKKYAITTMNYFIPRNGTYKLVLKDLNSKIEFIAKIKFIDESNGIVFTTEDESFNNNKYINKRLYELEFIEEMS
ncbi:MAG: FAD synthetase family protein [Gammaproteobacteria bacterium]|nr:FAD synthetase family protein [Gammaproteobacteria bacterium]